MGRLVQEDAIRVPLQAMSLLCPSRRTIRPLAQGTSMDEVGYKNEGYGIKGFLPLPHTRVRPVEGNEWLWAPGRGRLHFCEPEGQGQRRAAARI